MFLRLRMLLFRSGFVNTFRSIFTRQGISESSECFYIQKKIFASYFRLIKKNRIKPLSVLG